LRALITGAAGQLGRELVRLAPRSTTVLALNRRSLDILDAAAVHRVISEFRPTVVINAAAYTAVDNAESEWHLAQSINGKAPKALAQSVSTVPDCRLIHFSTDYVFSGDSPRAYLPSDTPNPSSAYGRSKLEGERAVLQTLATQAAVMRTAWVYGIYGRNFLMTMLRLMSERAAVRVVADQIGTPTAVHSLAHAAWRLAENRDISGILHWTDEGVASWYDFAVAIAEEAVARGLLPGRPDGVTVLAIATAEYPTPASRPLCSLLDKRSTAAALKLQPRHWRTELREVLARMQESLAVP
jgi:dTDP-4-dehydrorhamnose reductase